MKAKNDGLLRINGAVAPDLVWTHMLTRETEAFFCLPKGWVMAMKKPQPFYPGPLLKKQVWVGSNLVFNNAAISRS